MRKLKVVLLIAVLVCAGYQGHAEDGLFDKKKKKADTEKTEKKKDTPYDKLFKDKKAETVKGMVTIHKIEGKVYFEFPMSLFGKDMLIGSTITETTDNQFGSVGEKPSDPMHIRFVKVDSTVTLRWVPTGVLSRNENIQKRLDVSNTPAIIQSFEVKAYNNDSTAVVFDMTEYLLDDNKYMPPFSPYSPIEAMGADISKSFEKENSQILKIKAFADNISVQSSLTYKVSVGSGGSYAVRDMPFTTVLTRSFILLPEEPMRPRFADPRIGIFFQPVSEFASEGRALRSLYYANRWRLEPSDSAAYKRGELVEPKEPIVFYIDNAFPESWKPYIRTGVEKWKVAFEQAGFKNAIVAKDFPTDDPEFDPDNLKYTCIRYSPSATANAMGPSWTDPRSGQIINASVYVYHNIVELVQAWRFLQTAPADPDVRSVVMREDILGDCIEYVLSHEVGHCLSLMHNMCGSASIPVDSLRSPSFTQTYGTTYSIMDYARNNYVAQPGDKERGVQLTPPKLGIYDLYAIKWLYTVLPDAKTSKDEVATLDKWITEKSGDPIYRYGKQQFMYRFDPSSMEEDLGDDPMKASEYGIKNLKYLLTHMNEWVAGEDKDFAFRQTIYNELVYQYVRYMSFVLQNVGGIYLNERYDGDKLPSYSTVPKAKQKEALNFLLTQLQNTSWIDDKEALAGFPIKSDLGYNLEDAIIDGILSKTRAISLCAEKTKENPYTQTEYMSDIADFVWKSTRAGKTLTPAEKKLQMQFVSKMISGSVASVKRNATSGSAYAFQGIRVPESVKAASRERFGVLPVSFMGAFDNLPENGHVCLRQNPEEISGFSYELSLKAPVEPVEHLYYGELKKILSLVKNMQNSGSDDTRKHYRLLVYKIEQALK